MQRRSIVHYRLYLYVLEPVRTQYQSYLQEHYPDYTIIKADTEDLSASLTKVPADKDRLYSLFLCDNDKALKAASETGLARIAVRHSLNKDQDLMNAPFLIDSPEVLTADFLYEVQCRCHHLPMTILKTDRCLLRELTSNDLDVLLALQKENESNPAACFFPTEFFSANIPPMPAANDPVSFNQSYHLASNYLDQYIRHQYPFYGYGFYGIVCHSRAPIIGIAGFYDFSDHCQEPAAAAGASVEVGYALLKAYQGRGIMSEILPALVKYGIDHYELTHITARIPEDNNRSIQLASKCGLDLIIQKPEQ